MKIIAKVLNDKYYGEIDMGKADWRRLYYIYIIAFLSFSFFLLTVSGVLNH